jgi:ABC-type transporter Mla MlaB component
MIEVVGDTLKLKGPVNFSTYVELRENGDPHIGKGDLVIDWTEATGVDSSALSLLFAWKRIALEHNKTIRSNNFPCNLNALAELYGVEEFIKN